jgi:hypothetical protein
LNTKHNKVSANKKNPAKVPLQRHSPHSQIQELVVSSFLSGKTIDLQTENSTMSTEFEDEDAPPELIDVSAVPEQAPTDELPVARVPITLVTGMVS